VKKESSAFNNPPLICVVSRIQISPILDLEDCLGTLQRELRVNGYPDCTPSKHKNFTINNKTNELEVEETPKWFFSNKEKTVLLLLDKETIVLYFSDYKSFSHSQPDYKQILGIIEKVFDGVGVKALQMRYVDHIPMEIGSNATEWVLPSLLGMYCFGEFQRNVSVSETSMVTPENNQLIIRCSTAGRGKSLPIDLASAPLTWKYDSECSYPFITLDTIHSKQMNGTCFATKMIIDELSSLRKHLNTAFQNITTEKAQNQWK